VDVWRRHEELRRLLARRVMNDGQVLEPIYPATAAALSDGEISVEHARVITETVDKTAARGRRGA
jgi:hypothetical protein